MRLFREAFLTASVLVSRGCVTEHRRLGGPDRGDSLCLSSGGRKCKIEVSVRLVPSEAVRMNLFQAFLLAAGDLLAVLAVPWLVYALPQLTPTFLTWRSSCVQVCI